MISCFHIQILQWKRCPLIKQTTAREHICSALAQIYNILLLAQISVIQSNPPPCMKGACLFIKPLVPSHYLCSLCKFNKVIASLREKQISQPACHSIVFFHLSLAVLLI